MNDKSVFFLWALFLVGILSKGIEGVFSGRQHHQYLVFYPWDWEGRAEAPPTNTIAALIELARTARLIHNYSYESSRVVRLTALRTQTCFAFPPGTSQLLEIDAA